MSPNSLTYAKEQYYHKIFYHLTQRVQIARCTKKHLLLIQLSKNHLVQNCKPFLHKSSNKTTIVKRICSYEGYYVETGWGKTRPIPRYDTKAFQGTFLEELPQSDDKNMGIINFLGIFHAQRWGFFFSFCHSLLMFFSASTQCELKYKIKIVQK